jgi:uncharacterized protein (DUF1810 family)
VSWILQAWQAARISFLYQDLTRFLNAQHQIYLEACKEIQQGLKQLHWMCFTFPQLRGIEHSDPTQYYFAIKNMEEAMQYLRHPVLGSHLKEISKTLLEVKGRTAQEIFDLKNVIYERLHYQLYAIGNFYVEVYYDALSNEIVGKHPFISGKHLEKYLNNPRFDQWSASC